MTIDKFGERLWLVSWTSMAISACLGITIALISIGISGHVAASYMAYCGAGFGASAVFMFIGMGICMWSDL